MPSAETATDAGAETEEGVEAEETDEARSALLEALTDELGDALVGSHLMAGKDLWIRVTNESWADTADYLRNRQRFRFFDWLSAIDWMQSPYGRSHTAEVDKVLEAADGPADEGPASDSTACDSTADEAGGLTGTGADGVTGGDTRFQVIARVYNLSTKLGLTLKADVELDGSIATWTEQYPGANWHEREAWEMYGINFEGHPGLRKLYLPGDFEGHPLRKDFPLLARIVKPWPGIVDVEAMPPLPPVANGVPSETELPDDGSEETS